MRAQPFERLAGWAAIAVGVGGVAYSVAFLIFLHNGSRGATIVNSLLLLGGGLVTSMVLLVLYDRLRTVDPLFAVWGLVIGVFGGLASSLHGGHDLAVAIKHLSSVDVNPADPRGLATFGFTGIGVAVMSWLMLRDSRFPKRLSQLGLVTAAGLVLLFLGRISLYDPKRPVLLVLLVLVGVLLNPAWYVWVGRTLLAPAAPASPPPAPRPAPRSNRSAGQRSKQDQRRR